MGRRTYIGNAGATTLSSDITAVSTSIGVTDATNWPSPAGGTVSVAVIGRGTAAEEKVTFSGRTGNTLTGCVRGFDGTSGSTHSAGAAIEHGLSATDMDEVNDHTFTTTRDDHTQYLNNTRHDVTARHTFGAALGTPAAPADVGGAAASAGAGSLASRSDHVHRLNVPTVRVTLGGAGTINTATDTPINWGVEDWDSTTTMHSTVSNTSRLIAPVAGKYKFTFQPDWEVNVTGIRAAWVMKNNAGAAPVALGAGRLAMVELLATNPTPPPVTGTVSLALNDYIEAYVYQDSGGTRTFGPSIRCQASFEMTWIAP